MANKLFGVFEILKDINKFKQVFIDESGNIAWDKDTSSDSKNIRIPMPKYKSGVDIKETYINSRFYFIFLNQSLFADRKAVQTFHQNRWKFLRF